MRFGYPTKTFIVWKILLQDYKKGRMQSILSSVSKRRFASKETLCVQGDALRPKRRFVPHRRRKERSYGVQIYSRQF